MFKAKRVISTILIVVAFFGFHFSRVEAKLLPQAKGSGAKSTSAKSSAYAISAKLRKDRKALYVYFSGLQNVSSVTYSLSYQTNGKSEGVGGTIKPQGKTNDSRELLFGTCSSGTCRYHTNIVNAKLEVIANLASGKKVTKRFRIKV